ncbi:hypothetical protein Bealeia1_01349 [Candidatus Bealeia paramacronuclearis]|uniref:Uncharacterized protein n=1 Tax=Candidatus Bealeia paramacronuclearis TaxID=1921001 RepID=A0ABZ2C3X6_9PROT|nr:hypothetical protein [Candidatus Bealeia paramacronuclearis]
MKKAQKFYLFSNNRCYLILCSVILIWNLFYSFTGVASSKLKDDWCSCSGEISPSQHCTTDQQCSPGATGNGIFCNTEVYNCPDGSLNTCWYNGC